MAASTFGVSLASGKQMDEAVLRWQIACVETWQTGPTRRLWTIERQAGSADSCVDRRHDAGPVGDAVLPLDAGVRGEPD
jgi:hypothetical protein